MQGIFIPLVLAVLNGIRRRPKPIIASTGSLLRRPSRHLVTHLRFYSQTLPTRLMRSGTWLSGGLTGIV